jgi:fido (protein-threonine AMPylation protein)
MPTPREKLATALLKLKEAESAGIVRSGALSRVNRERLLTAGFLQEIVKGWYYVSNPTLPCGSTAWYGSYWEFMRQYLDKRFGSEYCLTAEASLLLHGGSTTIPAQLSVMSPKGDNKTWQLPLNTSLFIYQDVANFPADADQIFGLNVMQTAEALVRVGEGFFRNRPQDAAIVLQTITDPSPILSLLLDNGKSTVAGRIAGAFRHIGKPAFADRIVSTMKSATYDVRESNPFERTVPIIALSRIRSPYEVRIRAMWEDMREAAIKTLPPSPGLPADPGAYLQEVEGIYVADAYNSLSIEGYRVSEELIERVRTGNWNPDGDEHDRQSSDALAARGYYEAFQSVKETVSQIIRGAEPSIIRDAHHRWHQALYAPSVQAGILKPSDLAGYRNGPVIINGSQHVPLPNVALTDAMDALFDLIEREPSAAARAIMGHFIFVFIHPYLDGNGRLGRFLMNAMLASGGYPWTIIHLDARPKYMAGLEVASVGMDIQPFAEFISEEMKRQ